MTKLTDAIVRGAKAPADRSQYFLWDETAGFGVRVTANGAKAFVFDYRTKNGSHHRRPTIGKFPAWTCVAARARANDLRRIVDAGGDPQGETAASREAPTVADLCDRFIEEHLPKRRPYTAANYRLLIDKHVRPTLGRRKVADVAFADIDRLHRKIAAPYQANRVLALISKMYSLAIRWGYCTVNPVKGVERNTEHRRERYLHNGETAKLTAVLATHPNRQVANIIRVLLLTGARRGEVFRMRWEDIDFEAGTWKKPASSSKTKKAHTIPLSAPTRQLLALIMEEQKPTGVYVFPGDSKSGHVEDVKKGWSIICKAAGITGLRVHDLRHSFASQLVSSGASLPLIGGLLGHSNPATTARYAHLYDDPQRAAVEKVAALIDNAGKPAKEAVPFKRGGRHGKR